MVYALTSTSLFCKLHIVNFWARSYAHLSVIEPVVHAVIGAGAKAFHERARFEPDHAWQCEQLDDLFKSSSGLWVYLGDWHTHPDGRPKMSWPDRRTLRRIAKHSGACIAHPLMLIGAGSPAAWTIGYGHLSDPKHPPITEAQAEAYLAQDLKVALAATLRYCPVLATEPDGRLAAIVDLTFNLGAGRLQTSTLRRRVNQRDWSSAATELRRWVYGGGKGLPGLLARRSAEAALILRESAAG
jgi:lysozyme